MNEFAIAAGLLFALFLYAVYEWTVWRRESNRK